MEKERILKILAKLFEHGVLDCAKPELQLLVENFQFIEWDSQMRKYVLSDKGYAYLYGFPQPK